MSWSGDADAPYSRGVPSVETLSSSASRAPHPALRGLVEDYRGYRIIDVPPGIHHGLPSRVLTLVLAFDDPLEVGWLGRDETRRRFWSVASGLTTAPAAITHEGRQVGIQLGLSPRGARALFGMPASTLASHLVPFEDVVGPVEQRLYDAVSAGGGWETRFRALDRELLRLLAANADQRPRGEVRSELEWAWRWLGRNVGSGTVSRLAAELGWSRRHLSAQFRGEFGVSPKEVARVARFERSRNLLLREVAARHAPTPNALPGMPRPATSRPETPPSGAPRPGSLGLADIAAQCGYADQAHLTREWQAMAGYTPTQWRREEVPFVQDLQDSG